MSVAMGRSRSTPGLVESKGKVPVSEMQVNRKEQTSASTATLLTDDELKRAQAEDKKAEPDADSNGSDSSNKEMDDMHKSSVRMNTNGTNLSQPQSALLGCSPVPPTSQSQILYSPQLLTPSIQMLNYDRRSPQPQATLIPFYPHSPVSGSAMPAFCQVSPAASSSHLAVPHGVALHTPSPTLSSDSHHIQMSGAVVSDAPQDAALLAEIKRLRERLLSLETENASMTIKLSQQQWEVENRYVQ